MITEVEGLTLLKEQRVKVSELAVSQQELRARLKRFQEEHGLNTLGEIAQHLQLGNAQGLSRFMNRERAFCSGHTFDVLISALKAGDLAQRVASATDALPTQVLALSLFSRPIIDLVFDLKEFVYLKTGNRQKLNGIFKSHCELIGGLLRCSRGSLRRIEDQSFFIEVRTFTDKVIRNELPDVPTGNGPMQEPRKARELDRLSEFRDMCEILFAHYKNQRSICGALQIRYSVTGRVIRGEASKKEFDKVFARCKQLIAQLGLASKKRPAFADVQSESSGDVMGLGGETSSRGMKFVLGPKSFRQLEVESSQIPKIIALIKENTESCRRLLNLASQISDERSRTLIRKSVLGKEVEELELAMRLFSQKYPNKLLELNEQQREFWATIDKENP